MLRYEWTTTNLVQTFPASLTPDGCWEKAQAGVQDTVFTGTELYDAIKDIPLLALMDAMGFGK